MGSLGIDDDCFQRLHCLAAFFDGRIPRNLEVTIISTVLVLDFGCPVAWSASTARTALSTPLLPSWCRNWQLARLTSSTA